MTAEIVIAAATVATLIVTILIQRSGVQQAQGALNQRVTAAEDDIRELKEVDQRQWNKIGEHGEKIAALEARKSH